jgi:hypothetical protein
MIVSLPFLSLGPRIEKSGERLIARTSFVQALLCLGLFRRLVEVDPARKVVSVRDRRCWLFSREKSIRFDLIKDIIYRYDDFSIGLGWSAGQSTDCFRVGLRLLNLDEVFLFSFSGAGTFVNNSVWPDWMFWEQYALDFSGTQESHSRAFVEILMKMVGVSLVN